MWHDLCIAPPLSIFHWMVTDVSPSIRGIEPPLMNQKTQVEISTYACPQIAIAFSCLNVLRKWPSPFTCSTDSGTAH